MVANQVSLQVRDGNSVKTVPGGLTVFKIQSDGKLDFVKKYDLDVTADKALFWMTKPSARSQTRTRAAAGTSTPKAVIRP